jgi:hypothetical protein
MSLHKLVRYVVKNCSSVTSMIVYRSYWVSKPLFFGFFYGKLEDPRIDIIKKSQNPSHGG